MTAAKRAAIGFLAAALSVAIFHQGMVGLLHLAGIVPRAPWQFGPVPPLGVPALLNICFWGGLYGALFGLLLPKLPRAPMWLLGFGLGVLAAMVGWFVVAPIKGLPMAGGFVPARMLTSIAINGSFGIGVGIILPMLLRAAGAQRAEA
jgi:hypothetical protein